jgi:hypothetical protein
VYTVTRQTKNKETKTMTVKFEVGQTYNMSLRGYDMGVAKITKRTEKSVWLKNEDGLTKRYKINILDEKEIVQAKNLFTISATNMAEPQDTLEPVTKPQDLVTEPQNKTESVTISKHTKFEIGGLYWKSNDDIMDLVIVTEICPDRGVCVNAMRRSGDTWITDDLQGYFFNPKIVNNKEVIILNNGYHIKSDIPGDIMMYNAIVEIRAIDRQHTMEMLAEKFNTTFVDVSVTHHQTTLEPVTEPQDLVKFNHFDYIESHYVVKNPPGSENIYSAVPGSWTTLKSVAFTLITAWENGCLDMTVQHWITGLTRDELDTLLSVLVSMFSHAKIKSSQVNQIILGLMPNPVIVSSETPIDDETYAGILKAFDLDIYCGESVKQGHREYFAPVPRFDIEPNMYFIVSANVGEEYDTIFSVKKLNHALATPNAPNNIIEVDFSARRRKV